jgi:hypothetical protein
MNQSFAALASLRRLREQVKDLRARLGQGAPGESLARFDSKLLTLEGAAGGGPARPGTDAPTLTRLNADWNTLLDILQEADAAPTTQAAAAADELQAKQSEALAAWAELKTKELGAVNEMLRRANLPALAVE